MPFIPWEDIEQELNRRGVPEPVRVQMKMDWFKDFIENDPTVRQQIGDQGIQQFKQEFFASDPAPLRQELVQGQDDRTILEKALDALGDIIGKPLTVQKRGLSPEARAQATVELQARQKGIPVEEYREATRFEALPQAFMEEIPGVMALQRATTGIEPQKPIGKTGKVLEKLGHAGGFFLTAMGVPSPTKLPVIGKIISKISSPMSLEKTASKLAEAGLSKADILSKLTEKALTRRIPEEAAHLGMASTVASLNQILESKDATEAAKKMAHAAKSGAITGAIFGTLGKMFPASVPQRPGRVLTGLLALEAQHILEDSQHRMFWKRGDPLDLITDTAMSLFFLWNGGGEAALAKADQVLNSVNGKPIERVFSDYAEGKISTKDLLNLDKRHRQLEFSGPYQKYKDIVEMVESEPSIEGKLRIIDTMLERSDQVKAYGLEPALEELRSSIEEGVPRDKVKEPPQYIKKPELKSSKKVAKELEDAVAETTKDIAKPPEEAGKAVSPLQEQAQRAVGAEEVSPEVAGVRRIVEEVVKERPEGAITKKDGTPFKTKAAVQSLITKEGLARDYEPMEVEGGWIARPIEPQRGGEPGATRLREDEGRVLPPETTGVEEAEQGKPSTTEGTTTTAEKRPAEGGKNLEQPTPEQPGREREITPQLDELRSNLNPLQVKVIDKRVRELGNVEAVKNQYRDDTDSGRYAIALAEQLYGKESQLQPSREGKITLQPDKTRLTKEDVGNVLAKQPLNKGKSPKDLIDKWVSSDNFTLMDIPVDSVGIATKPGGISKTEGPIIVDENVNEVGRYKGRYGTPPNVIVLDGKHRLAKAIQSGKKTIKAYVGDKAIPYLEQATKQFSKKQQDIAEAVISYWRKPNGTTLRKLSITLSDKDKVNKIREARKAFSEGNLSSLDVFKEYKNEPWANEVLNELQTKGALYGREPQPQPSQSQEIRTKTGKPFKTKGALVLQLKRRGLVDTHEPVQVEGGWVARPKKEHIPAISKEQPAQEPKQPPHPTEYPFGKISKEEWNRKLTKDNVFAEKVIEDIRNMGVNVSPAGDMHITSRTDIDELADKYPLMSIRVKDVNGHRATINITNFAKLAKIPAFTDRVRSVQLYLQYYPEEKGSGFMDNIFEIGQRKLLQGKEKRTTEPIKLVEGIDYINNSTITRTKQAEFISALTNPRVQKYLEKYGIKKFIIDPPYKFELSEQANIDKKRRVLRINADVDNPVNSILHEIGHLEYDKLSKEKRRKWASILSRIHNKTVDGYKKLNLPEEAYAETFAHQGEEWADEALKKLSEAKVTPKEVEEGKEKAKEEKLPVPATSRPKAKMTQDQIEVINGAIDLHKYYLNRGGETLLHLEEAAKEGIIPKELVKPILDRIVQLERQGKLGETGAEWRYSVKKVREYFDDILAKKGFEAATTSKKTKPRETESSEPTIEKVDIPLVREKSSTYPDVYTTYDEVFKAKPDIVIVRRRIVHDPSKPDLKKYYEYLTYEREGDKWVLQKGIGCTRTDALKNFEHFEGKELDVKAIEKKILEKKQPEQQLPTTQKTEEEQGIKTEEKQRLQQLQQQIEPYTPEKKPRKPGISQIGLGKRDFQWFLGKTKDGKKIYISKAILDISEPRYLQAKQIKEPEGSTTPIVDTEVFKDWTKPVEPIAVHRNFEGIEKKGDVLYFDVNGKLVAVYKPYIDYFRHKYGKIELKINPQKDPVSSPLAIYHNGKFVGVVMPLYSKGSGIFPTTEEVRSIIKEQPSTIDTLKSKAVSTIKSNKGTSAIINDVAKLGAELIRRGYTKLSDFKRQLRQQLSDVWEQVKPLIGRIYLVARQVTLSQRGAVGEVTEDEVKPYLKPKDRLHTTTLAKTAKKASSAIEVIPQKVQEVFAPAEVSERAGEIAYRLRKARGKTYEVVTRLEQQLKTAQDIIDRLPKEVIDKAQYLYETGNADKIKDPTLHRFFAKILPELDKVSLHFINQTQKLLGRKAIEGLSNYLAHLYKDPQKATSVLSDILSGKTRTEAGGQQFLKHRVIPTYAEAEALGLERRFKNPIDTALYHIEAAIRWAETMRMFKELKDDGLIKFFRVSKKGTEAKLQYPDWVRLKDPAFTALFPTEKGVVVAGSYYAPPDVARILNNASSRGMADFKTFQALRSATNFVNMLNMSMSIFHGSFSAVTNGMNYLAMALADLPRLRLKSAARNLARAALSAPIPIQTIRDVIEGKRMIDASEYTPIVKFYMRSGGKIGLDPLYDITYTRPERLLKQAMAEGRLKGLRNPALLLSAVLDKLNTPIMRIMVPALKVRAFEELFMHEMSRKNIDMPLDEFMKTKEGEKLAQHIVDLVEDRFGQMNYDNLHWNRFLKHGLQLTLRTVGWNYGDIREVIGAGTSITSAMKELAKGNFEGAKGRITQRVFFTMAVPLMHMYISGLLTYLLTGERPKGKDWVAPRSKTGERYSIPSYFRDWMAVKYQGIPTTIKHKLNPIWNIVADQITNTDYWGTKLTRRDDPVLQQLWDRIEHIGDQLLPFSVQSLERTRSGKGKVLSMVGLTKAPTYITRTPIQRLIFELYEEEHHGQIKTKSEAEAQRFKAKIRQKYQETGKIPYDMINEATKKGYLPSRLSRTMFIRSLPTEGWQRAFRGLSAESQLEVLKQATEEERLKLWKYAKRMAKIMYNKWKTRRNNKYSLSKISSTVRR